MALEGLHGRELLPGIRLVVSNIGRAFDIGEYGMDLDSDRKMLYENRS
jgi:hypothetical protein